MFAVWTIYVCRSLQLVILLTRDVADIPFDLKHRRHIVYGSSIQILREQLIKDLEWAKSEISNFRKSRIRVNTKSITGDLYKTKYDMKARVYFEIDLHNDSDVPSPEIEAVYFYARNDWILYQNESGGKCPITESDIKNYNYKYFLVAPIKRLSRSGWVQLRFNSERVIARFFKGEEIKDKYPITGRAMLRLSTDKGSFDYEIDINIVLSESPF